MHPNTMEYFLRLAPKFLFLKCSFNINKFVLFKINLSIESHFVGVHRPYELHRKEKQIECTVSAIQYLYLHLFTTKFVAVLLTLTQKCHISQISNEQKVRHLEQPAPGEWRTEQSRLVIKCKYYEQKVDILKV